MHYCTHHTNVGTSHRPCQSVLQVLLIAESDFPSQNLSHLFVESAVQHDFKEDLPEDVHMADFSMMKECIILENDFDDLVRYQTSSFDLSHNERERETRG